ncbi:hypothetical protein D3C84_1087540 [compost metagenome]
MNDAGTVPQQHVGTGLTLNVGAQVLVRPPDDGFAVIHQAFDDFQRTARRHHPVRTGFDRRRGIGVNHHRTLRMLVAECGKLIDRTPQVQ